MDDFLEEDSDEEESGSFSSSESCSDLGSIDINLDPTPDKSNQNNSKGSGKVVDSGNLAAAGTMLAIPSKETKQNRKKSSRVDKPKSKPKE